MITKLYKNHRFSFGLLFIFLFVRFLSELYTELYNVIYQTDLSMFQFFLFMFYVFYSMFSSIVVLSNLIGRRFVDFFIVVIIPCVFVFSIIYRMTLNEVEIYMKAYIFYAVPGTCGSDNEKQKTFLCHKYWNADSYEVWLRDESKENLSNTNHRSENFLRVVFPGHHLPVDLCMYRNIRKIIGSVYYFRTEC